MGKVYGRTASDFAGEAIALALEDAGLEARRRRRAADQRQPVGRDGADAAVLARARGPDARQRDERLRLDGRDDAPVRGPRDRRRARRTSSRACTPTRRCAKAARSRSRRYSGRRFSAPGFAGLRFAYGDYGPANSATRWRCGGTCTSSARPTTSWARSRSASAQWALMNPRAQMRKPMTIDDYHASRWVVEPLHLFDCCLVSNGGVAVIVTSARAGARPAPAAGLPARLRPVRARRHRARPSASRRSTRAPPSPGELALRQAGIELADVDVLELYDCYTYTVLVTLEDYGFCAKGEGGAFVADGKLGPGGSLPCNTGGGQLSSYYMWGFTPLSEGVIQARGQGGERQVRQARPRPRLRQRRRPELPLDHDPQHARGRGPTDDDDRRAGQAGPGPRRGQRRRSSTARCGAS